MALTKDDLCAIEQLFDKKMDEKLESIIEQQATHTRSIMTLENKVMHELKLLNENLPDVIARHEELNDLRETVDDHDNRILRSNRLRTKKCFNGLLAN